MAMATSRRATSAKASGSVVKALAEAQTPADIVEAIRNRDADAQMRLDRRELSSLFQAFCDAHAGEKGNASVSYTQKIHWALLDTIALQATKIDAAMSAIVILSESLANSEKQVKSLQAKSLDSKFSLDDLRVEQIGDRRVRVVLAKGQDEADFELTFPVLIGRGVWNAEAEYERGDICQWGGTAWEAVEPVKGVKPDQSNRGWRILAKRGRDAKDTK